MHPVLGFPFAARGDNGCLEHIFKSKGHGHERHAVGDKELVGHGKEVGGWLGKLLRRREGGRAFAMVSYCQNSSKSYFPLIVERGNQVTLLC